jgi:NAD(P)-dependent dehydrogenase (short-subunit alcohol dehydrogenase family)
VSAQGGIDIARSFAEAGARLILQCDDTSPAVEALARLLAPTAVELSLHTVTLPSTDDVVAFAREAAAEFGGLDMVVNIVAIDGRAPAADATYQEIEAPTDRAFAQVLRATLAAMTRREAQAWAEQGIRFNAVAPDVLSVVAKPSSGREADVAQLALYLAAGEGKSLSGVTFEMGLLAPA